MPDDNYVELREGYVYARLPKGMPSSVTVDVAKSAVAMCAERNVFKLMTNIRDFAENPPPTMELFSLVVSVSRIWNTAIKLAVVDPAKWLKLDTFGGTVARNRGINFSHFTSEEDALKWLLA